MSRGIARRCNRCKHYVLTSNLCKYYQMKKAILIDKYRFDVDECKYFDDGAKKVVGEIEISENKSIKIDCFAYSKRGCSALIEMTCRLGKCGFYKNKQDFQKGE